MGFENESYKRHSSSYVMDEKFSAELAMYSNWFESGTTDVWRHLDMLSVLHPFLENDKGAEWLTVGDGRFGTSAIFIEKNGGKALATDIDDTLLKIAHQKSLISNFKNCNAEKLDLDDLSFDYSYCKQSFHHFPRPVIAVYEMLRVSRKAIIFTEPADWIPLSFTRSLLQKIKHTLKKLAGKEIPHHDTGNYESVGNYVYTISEREFEKIALGLNLPAVAFKRFEDVYFEGVEYEQWSEDSALFKKIKSERRRRKLRRFFGLQQPNNIQAIIFKKIPPDKIVSQLKNTGYRYILLPANPFTENHS